MKSALIVSTCAFALFVAGCGNSSNNPNNLSAYSTPQGNYQMQQSLPLTDTSAYTVGCTQAGTTTAVPQVDPRVVVNMTFGYSIKGFTDGNSFQLGATTVIQSVTSSVITDSYLINFAVGVSGVNTDDSGTDILTLNTTTGKFDVTENPARPNPFGNSFTNCNVTQGTSIGSFTLDKGIFTTQTGVQFSAYRVLLQANGSVTCGDFTVNAGSVSISAISSNDIPSPDSATFCGGTPVFASLVASSSDGSVGQALSFERTAVGR